MAIGMCFACIQIANSQLRPERSHQNPLVRVASVFKLTGVTRHITVLRVIKTFKHKGLKEVFEKGNSKSVPQDMLKKIVRRLDVLDAAQTISGVNVPGFRLHELKGNRKGTWSIDVSGNDRTTFRFENGDAHDVNLEDTHK